MQLQTNAQTVLIYWQDLYNADTLVNVACTSGYTTAPQHVHVDCKGVTTEALRTGATIIAASDESLGVELDSRVCAENDGSFTSCIMAVPIWDSATNKVVGIVQLRNKILGRVSWWAKIRQKVDPEFSNFTREDEMFVTWSSSVQYPIVEGNVLQKMMMQRFDHKFEDSDDAELHMVEIIGVFANEVRKLVQADRSSVYLVDRLSGEIFTPTTIVDTIEEGVSQTKRTVVRLPIGKGIAGECAATHQQVIVDDAYEDSRFSDKWDVENDYRTKEILCVPITSSSNMVLGVVQMINSACGVFTQVDADRLQALVSKAMPAIEKAHHAMALKTIERAASEAMSMSHNVDQLMSATMEAARKLLLADRCTLLLLDKTENKLWSRVTSGGEAICIEIPADKGIAGEVVKSKKILNVTNAQDHPMFDSSVDAKTGYKTVSILAVPIIGNNSEEVLGVIEMINRLDPTQKVPIAFDGQDQHLINTFMKHISLAFLSSQLSQDRLSVADMARSLPHLLVAVSPDKLYTHSNYELADILTGLTVASSTPTEGKPMSRRRSIEDMYKLSWLYEASPGLEEDLVAVLKDGKSVVRPEAAFPEGFLRKGGCTGYEVHPMLDGSRDRSRDQDISKNGVLIVIRASF